MLKKAICYGRMDGWTDPNYRKAKLMILTTKRSIVTATVRKILPFWAIRAI